MPNLLLTTRCNLSCTYCFAKERMSHNGHRDISMEDVTKVISILKRSNDFNFRLMGGEPTTHPRFKDIVLLAAGEGMHIDLLSNGTWPNAYNELFGQISPNKLLFLLNIDHPDNYTPALWKRIETNLFALAGRRGVSLSFNIFSKNPQYQYLFELTTKYNIRRVRLSFSLPVLDTHNTRLDLEEYGDMADFIIAFTRQCAFRGVEVQLDNAVPLCIFSNAQAGELLLKGILDLNRNARCRPIIDIGPDLSVWPCFCLSSFNNRQLDEFDTIPEIVAYYETALRPYQEDIFPMEKCYDCDLRTRWGCQGGCTTFSIEQGRQDAVAKQDSRPDCTCPSGDAIVTLGDGITLTRYSIPEETLMMKNEATGAEVELGTGFGPLLALLDGHHTFSQISEALLSRSQMNAKGGPLASFEKEILKESHAKILSSFIEEKFLVLKEQFFDFE